MAVGSIATSILTDIANAIRYQAGVATLYQPRQMAAAVAALDGSNAGNYQAQSYMVLERGYLANDVFGDIADAIRAQNGTQTQYLPEEMAAAILGLSWPEYKVRALLLDNDMIEFNYLDSVRTNQSGRTVVASYEVDLNGYSADTARPWHSIRSQVWRVIFDPSMSSAGVTNGDYWFKGFSGLKEVANFDYMSSLTSAVQMFASCSKLDTIYAMSFTNNISSGANMFYGCPRLVGSYDFFVPKDTDCGAAHCSLSTNGVLTDVLSDPRIWFWAHLYDDGVAKLSNSSTADPWYEHDLVDGCRVCAQGRYQALGHTPWDNSNRSSVTSGVFDSSMAGYSVMNLNYIFYGCYNLTGVSGLGNLAHVHSMRYAFAGCSSLTSVDFSGFDPSELTDLFYCFSGCSALTTILADATWALPSSGVSGSGCFYNCSTSLVGGNGTVWSSSNTGYQYMRIDAAGSPGYLTAA